MNHNLPYKKIIVNTVFQYISKIVSVALSLISVGLLTRYLGEEKYGWFTLVFTYVSFFTMLTDVGYNQTIVREYAHEKQIPGKTSATYLNFKLILIGIFMLLAFGGLIIFPYETALKIAIAIGITAVAVSSLVSYGTSILQSQLNLDVVAMIDILVKLITVILIILFVYLKLDLYFMIISVLVGNFIGLIVELVLIKDFIVFEFYLDRKVIRKILNISIPVGVTGFLTVFYFKIDTIMLSLMRSSSEVGIYGLSYKILENILLFWGLFMASIYPLLSKYYSNFDLRKYKDLLKKTLLLLFSMSVLIIISGYIFSPSIISILGGKNFYSSIIPFRILLWSVPFLLLDNVFYNMILSIGKSKYLILPLLISLILNILLNIYAIPQFGYVGASYVTVIVEIITALAYAIILLTKFDKELTFSKHTK